VKGGVERAASEINVDSIESSLDLGIGHIYDES
jgi:hypothetical protein